MADSAATATPRPERVWYKPEERGHHRMFNLDMIHGEWSRDRTEPGRRNMNMPGQRWLAGYILPPFQRAFRWTEEQQVRFIESAARGLPLGTWTYNNAMDFPDVVVEGKRYYNATDRWLIDGQQRIMTLVRFFEDAFPVYGYRWSEVPKVEQVKFLMQAFGANELRCADEAELRRIYNLMNFGGSAHTEDERA